MMKFKDICSFFELCGPGKKIFQSYCGSASCFFSGFYFLCLLGARGVAVRTKHRKFRRNNFSILVNHKKMRR